MHLHLEKKQPAVRDRTDPKASRFFFWKIHFPGFFLGYLRRRSGGCTCNYPHTHAKTKQIKQKDQMALTPTDSAQLQTGKSTQEPSHKITVRFVIKGYMGKRSRPDESGTSEEDIRGCAGRIREPEVEYSPHRHRKCLCDTLGSYIMPDG